MLQLESNLRFIFDRLKRKCSKCYWIQKQIEPIRI